MNHNSDDLGKLSKSLSQKLALITPLKNPFPCSEDEDDLKFLIDVTLMN